MAGPQLAQAVSHLADALAGTMYRLVCGFVRHTLNRDSGRSDSGGGRILPHRVQRARAILASTYFIPSPESASP